MGAGEGNQVCWLLTEARWKLELDHIKDINQQRCRKNLEPTKSPELSKPQWNPILNLKYSLYVLNNVENSIFYLVKQIPKTY